MAVICKAKTYSLFIEKEITGDLDYLAISQDSTRTKRARCLRSRLSYLIVRRALANQRCVNNNKHQQSLKEFSYGRTQKQQKIHKRGLDQTR
jgi:hypothetical protein